MGKTSNEVKSRYRAKAYDSICVTVPKGMREKIKAFAEGKGLSLNGWINKLIEEAMSTEAEGDNGDE